MAAPKKKTLGENAADTPYLKKNGQITPQSNQLLMTSIQRNRAARQAQPPTVKHMRAALAQHLQSGHTGPTHAH